MQKPLYDLIIIGASAVGTGAGIYAASRKLNFFIISENIGGEVASSGEIGNWPGIIETNGIELADQFKKHLDSYGVEIKEGWRVEKIEPIKNYHIVHAKRGNEIAQFETKTVVVGSGIHPRHLGVPGEEEHYGKGITYCTVCDGPLYKNKTTVTIGGGNSALESALMMVDIAKKVYVLNLNAAFRGEQILIDKLTQKDNVEIIFEAKTKEIVGEGLVSGVKYDDKNGQEHMLDVQGVMIHIGMVPNSDLVDVKKNDFKEIIVDAKCATSVPGIFAAGDVTNIPYKQIAIAAGQGVTAALAAIEYINRWSAV